jgi:hypothetical protein
MRLALLLLAFVAACAQDEYKHKEPADKIADQAKLGCGTDENGVVGTRCEDVCECGARECDGEPEGLSKLHFIPYNGTKDYSRCYEHDPVTEAAGDCKYDVRCCIPVSECPEACGLEQQESINLLMLAITNASTDRCAEMFLQQLHGNAQDEYELCLCLKAAIEEVENTGTIAEYNAAVQALNDANCRVSDGELRTVHEITLMCMSTNVVGDPFLAVGEEKIKFFLPPGDMVDLITWVAPSGKPVTLRGSTFRQKGAAKGNNFKNVQWFRNFEIAIANTTLLSITSFHGSQDAKSTQNLLALQPGEDPSKGLASSWLGLANSEAVNDPGFTPEHKERKSFVGIRLDGKDIFPQSSKQALAEYRSVLGAEIGLKLTAVQTKEHKIGDELSDRVDVVTDKFKFRVWSSKAGKFADERHQVKYSHLNLNLLGPFPPHVGGFFAELRGKVPMTEQSKSFLRKTDLEPPGE